MEWSSAAADGTSGPAGTAPPDGPPGAGPGTADAWHALRGDPALLDRVGHATRPGLLPARLPVLGLARASVAACSLAAAELSSVRSAGGEVPEVRVDDGAVAAAFSSERKLLIDGRSPVNFAPLSRFWPTADGWLRTHANYPHHRARLLHALGVDDSGDDAAAAAVARLLAERKATEVEEAVFAAGGLAVAVRGPEEWAEHPQGTAVAAKPLLTLERLDSAPALPFRAPGEASGAARGLRVLDLTRVIAGPVATRTLALLGAQVLRLDPPHLPEPPDAHADTGFGKRSATLDLARRSGQATFEELLSSADVVLTGYRPGALDRFGLAPESLADRRPGLVVGQLSAWGAPGPWHRRRGFDSLVQAATGIAATESAPDGTPGALPVQALDHGTGYLLAAAVLRAVTEAHTATAGSRVLRLTLARTATWLLNTNTPPAQPTQADTPLTPWLTESDTPLGHLHHARSPLHYTNAPTTWPHPPGHPGTDPCTWW
ncbi:CoA transferase [Streptomyces sp. HNM0574]|uniref:CoA transferase n=1 Tax=Streptomyces sp. HNM0574 TaxID=2714954 RepID=UPI00146DEB6D|nr:CoA transferase [Streptomyces sp. HNM0574]NLU68937.1 hypothetical protein [Streptomyces sp. HNM0574]